jgi:hypothetical protein
MSARDTPLRERALSDTLTSMRAQVGRLAKRTRLPGASRLVSAARDGVSLSTQLSSGSSAPTPVWGELISMDLDPGRWFVSGSAVITAFDLAPAFRRCGIRVAGETESVNSYRVDSKATTWAVGLQAHAIVTLSEVGTVQLESFQQSYNTTAAAGTRTSTGSNFSLTAYPL